MATAAKRKQQLTEGLAHVEELTERYAEVRQTLVDRVTKLDSELRAARMRALAGIKKAAADVKDAQAELKVALEENKAEFEKPRTRTFAGIKVGFRKLVGSITWTDGEKVIALIKKHFADQAEVLIKTTETPVKDALAQLPAADLKRLGVSVGEDTDEAVIKATDSEIEKLVDALLKESAGD
jgi:hypothetical protein